VTPLISLACRRADVSKAAAASVVMRMTGSGNV